MIKLSPSSELRKVTISVQFYDNAKHFVSSTKVAVVEAPFYKKLRKEHPQYRAVINKTIADLAEQAGFPRDHRPIMTSIQ